MSGRSRLRTTIFFPLLEINPKGLLEDVDSPPTSGRVVQVNGTLRIRSSFETFVFGTLDASRVSFDLVGLGRILVTIDWFNVQSFYQKPLTRKDSRTLRK